MKKLSELKDTDLVIVDSEYVMEVQDLDEEYNDMTDIHIAIPGTLKLDAKDILEYMWERYVRDEGIEADADFTDEDIADMQKILDRHEVECYRKGEKVDLEENTK